MRLGLPIVWSDRHRRHEPGGEVWSGVRTPGTGVPRRGEAIRDALRACDAPFVAAEPHPDDDVLAVHDAALVDYLRTAWDEWTAAGLPSDPGQDRVVPYVFAHAGLTPHAPPAVPVATWPRPGYFAYDTMTLIGPGTYEAPRAAVDAALTAADLGQTARQAPRTPSPARRATTSPARPTAARATSAARRPPPRGSRRPPKGPWPSSTSTPTTATARSRCSTSAPTSSPAPSTSTRAPAGSPHFLGPADETGAGANRNVPLPPARATPSG